MKFPSTEAYDLSSGHWKRTVPFITGQLALISDDIKGSNGLCFSPDESKLYIVEARATPNRLFMVSGSRCTPSRNFRSERIER
jgi:sugar lactone lactonase YvrE